MSGSVTGLPELEATIVAIQAGLGADVGAAVGAGLDVMHGALVSASPAYGKSAIGKRFDDGGTHEVNAKTGIHVGQRNLGMNRAPGGSRKRKRVMGRIKGNRWSRIAQVAPHAHLIELGTEERWTRRGFYRGRVDPQPFVRRTEANTTPAVWAAVLRSMEAAEARWVAKAEKRAAKVDAANNLRIEKIMARKDRTGQRLGKKMAAQQRRSGKVTQ